MIIKAKSIIYKSDELVNLQLHLYKPQYLRPLWLGENMCISTG